MSNGFSVASWKQYNGMPMAHPGMAGSQYGGRDEMSSKESARRHSGSFSQERKRRGSSKMGSE